MTRRLLILDIDNTLLHTWQFNEIAVALRKSKRLPTGYPDDFDPISYQELLLNSFSNALKWEEAVVCPRPHLDQFLSHLLELNIDIGIYSTAVLSYLESVLSTIAPSLVAKSKFIWTRAEINKQDNSGIKDIAFVCQEFGYNLSTTCIIDDLPIVTPWENRLFIHPFKVNPANLNEAIVDTHLLDMMEVVNRSLQIEDFSILRKSEYTALCAWEKEYDNWTWKAQLKLEESDSSPFSKPRPETLAYPYDGQPEH